MSKKDKKMKKLAKLARKTAQRDGGKVALLGALGAAVTWALANRETWQPELERLVARARSSARAHATGAAE
jgi:hypothetical protein